MKPIYVDARDLDPNQVQIYNQKLDSSFIVRGCAGSGKTSLALLRMKQLLATESENDKTPFYYITFVRELVECIRKEIGQLPDFTPQFNDYAITYDNWKSGIITSWLQRKFNIQARGVMCEDNGIRVNKNPDYLFIDECQDFEIGEIESLMRCNAKGINFYGDDGQHIMQWQNRSPVLLEDIKRRFKLEIHDLIINYRLPKEIAKFAEQIGGKEDLSLHCKGKYHEKPFMIKVKDKEELCDFIFKRVSNNGLQDVGIAFSRNEEVKDVYNILRRQLGGGKVSASWNIPDAEKDYGYLSETPVKIMTYHKIKGQQFEAVFLFISGELDSEMIKRFYVGVTRAERFLYVLYTDPMPAVLRQIPVDLYNVTDEAANFSELFKRPAPRIPDGWVAVDF